MRFGFLMGLLVGLSLIFLVIVDRSIQRCDNGVDIQAAIQSGGLVIDK